MSTDVTFFEITSFSLSSPVTSQGEDDNLLVYTIASPALSAPTPTSVPIRPPITQVYSRHQNPLASSPTLAASSPDPVQNDDLQIASSLGCRDSYPLLY